MTKSATVIVVGGGIVGTSIAHYLAAEGIAVTLFERGEIGGAATAAGMGHIVVMNDNPAEFALTRYSRALWDEVAGRAPAACEYQRTGTLWVAADREELEYIRPLQRFYAENGVAAELLDTRQVAAAEPQLREGLAGGLRVPGDAVVFAPEAARWLAKAAQVVQAKVLHIGERCVHLEDGSRREADAVVCASGLDAVDFFPQLPMKARKGHLALATGYEGFIRHDLIELGYLKSVQGNARESVAFNVQPRLGGRLLLGSSRQFGVDDPAVEEHMMAKMLGRVAEYLPGLAVPRIARTWTGFRAATADKLPYIGRVPGMESVYIGAGHEGLGISTAMATGALLRDLILGRAPAIDPRPYSPERVH